MDVNQDAEKTPKNRRVVIVSDACLGYGSPQIPAFAHEILKIGNIKITVVEPNVPKNPPKNYAYSDFEIRRIHTSAPIYSGGRAEYCEKCARFIETTTPSVVILICTFSLPVLLYCRFKPIITLYYSIESIVQYGKQDIELNREMNNKIDAIIWPEENRMKRDTVRCQFQNVDSYLSLNSSNQKSSSDNIVPWNKRKKRIIHQGTIGSKETFSHYFMEKEIARLPIDVYGPIVDQRSRTLESLSASVYNESKANLIYQGRIDLDQLELVRREMAYSICIWSPETERGLFAPSNKFFEAIADGVPPITAPHPQHVRIIEKYDCGIILDDWSLRALRKGLLYGLRIFGTGQYESLVENCRTAVRTELNREHQYRDVVQLIRTKLDSDSDFLCHVQNQS